MHVSQSLYSLLQVNDPIVLELPNDRTDTYIRAIRETSEAFPTDSSSDIPKPT